MNRPKCLDLFCGAGGAGMGLHQAGFDVTGVDIKPQPRYPFTFIQADAMTYPLDGFDFIWASPPCQAYSSLRVMPNARSHPELIDATRNRLMESGLPFVIENVVGAPLTIGSPSLFTPLSGVMLCGSMFGLNNGAHELRRHRLFESNESIPQLSCRHRLDVIGFYGDHARTRQRTIAGNRNRGGDITGNAQKLALVRDLMGIDWMKWDEAVLAIPPAYSKWIGEQMRERIGTTTAPIGGAR